MVTVREEPTGEVRSPWTLPVVVCYVVRLHEISAPKRSDWSDDQVFLSWYGRVAVAATRGPSGSNCH